MEVKNHNYNNQLLSNCTENRIIMHGESNNVAPKDISNTDQKPNLTETQESNNFLLNSSVIDFGSLYQQIQKSEIADFVDDYEAGKTVPTEVTHQLAGQIRTTNLFGTEAEQDALNNRLVNYMSKSSLPPEQWDEETIKTHEFLANVVAELSHYKEMYEEVINESAGGLRSTLEKVEGGALKFVKGALDFFQKGSTSEKLIVGSLAVAAGLAVAFADFWTFGFIRNGLALGLGSYFLGKAANYGVGKLNNGRDLLSIADQSLVSIDTKNLTTFLLNDYKNTKGELIGLDKDKMENVAFAAYDMTLFKKGVNDLPYNTFSEKVGKNTSQEWLTDVSDKKVYPTETQFHATSSFKQKVEFYLEQAPTKVDQSNFQNLSQDQIIGYKLKQALADKEQPTVRDIALILFTHSSLHRFNKDSDIAGNVWHAAKDRLDEHTLEVSRKLTDSLDKDEVFKNWYKSTVLELNTGAGKTKGELPNKNDLRKSFAMSAENANKFSELLEQGPVDKNYAATFSKLYSENKEFTNIKAADGSEIALMKIKYKEDDNTPWVTCYDKLKTQSGFLPNNRENEKIEVIAGGTLNVGNFDKTNGEYIMLVKKSKRNFT